MRTTRTRGWCGECPLAMVQRRMENPDQTQIDKFKKAARELECDDDEQRFKERLAKLARQKPVEKPA